LNSTESINDPYAAAKEKLNRENPRSWIWDEDGAEVGGYYWKPDFWKQKDGTETEVRLIHTNAGYRAVWLFESPQDLRRVFKELDEEGLAEGDFVYIRRLPRREFVTETGERRKPEVHGLHPSRTERTKAKTRPSRLPGGPASCSVADLDQDQSCEAESTIRARVVRAVGHERHAVHRVADKSRERRLGSQGSGRVSRSSR
jgi:hypothetical protein